MARAVDSVQTRQSSAERDVFAEQQQAVAAAASSGAGLAAAAEDAVMTSCEVAQQLLQQLEELGTSGVMDLMKEVRHVRTHAGACLCICVETKLVHVHNVDQRLPSHLSLPPPPPPCHPPLVMLNFVV